MAINFTEGSNTSNVNDLKGNDLGSVGLGENTIAGAMAGTYRYTSLYEPDGGSDDGDAFRFTVPAGLVVSQVELIITNYTFPSGTRVFGRTRQDGLAFEDVTGNATFSNLVIDRGGLLPGNYDYQLDAGIDTEIQPDAPYNLNYRFNITVVENTAPTDISLSNSSITENSPSGSTIGSFSTTDTYGWGHTYSLVSGTGSTDNGLFTLDGKQFKINPSPDFETKSSYSIRVKTTDALGAAYEEALTITVNDVVENSAPTAVNFSNTTTALNETASTADRIKVADVTLIDDGQGTNVLSLTGSDASAFELDGSVLYLKAGTTLDYETKTSYSVTVNADDASVGTTPDASKTFTLNISDVVENTTPTATGETVSTSKNTAVTVELGDNVTDAETLTGATLNVTGSSNGTTSIDQDARLVTFTPTAGFSGTASFNYTITDAGGFTSTAATVTVEVGDIISTGNKSQNIQGNEGNDYISAGNGKDIIQGLGGNDTLLGNNGADTIDGGTGDDLINGGNGPDLLAGGSGKDRFVLTKSAGGDTITDFADGFDLLALSGGLSFGQLTITGSNGNTLVQSGTTTLATLTGVNSSLITAADFVTV